MGRGHDRGGMAMIGGVMSHDRLLLQDRYRYERRSSDRRGGRG